MYEVETDCTGPLRTPQFVQYPSISYNGPEKCWEGRTKTLSLH